MRYMVLDEHRYVPSSRRVAWTWAGAWSMKRSQWRVPRMASRSAGARARGGAGRGRREASRSGVRFGACGRERPEEDREHGRPRLLPHPVPPLPRRTSVVLVALEWFQGDPQELVHFFLECDDGLGLLQAALQPP